MSVRALATLCCFSVGWIFYSTWLDDVQRNGILMDALHNTWDEAGDCNFRLPYSDLTLHDWKLERELRLMLDATQCPDTQRPLPESLRTNGRWQVQDTGYNKLVLYSAFYDDRPSIGLAPWIRVIGVAQRERKTQYCYIWYHGCKAPYVSPVIARVSGRSDGYTINGTRYVQYLFSCRLAGVEPVPSHVSIVADLCAQSTIYLPVERPVRAEPDIEFGVCVSISFGNIPTPLFVEWMELTWMLGVREFNVYDAGMVNMSDVFDYYTRRGWLRVHQMPPPVPAETFLRSPSSHSEHKVGFANCGSSVDLLSWTMKYLLYCNITML